MKNNFKIIILCLIIVGAGILTGIIINVASAQTLVAPLSVANINYPIAALGNCQSQSACKTYCDNPANLNACINYAQENNLMSQDDINAAKKFLAAGAKGPGGCTSKDSCQSYCNDIKHINECVAFAQKTGILPPDKLAEAEQVQAAINKGVQPPSCSSKEECDVYCRQPANMKACITFGEAAGLLRGQDLANAQKALVAINKGVLPPPCGGEDECKTYCADPAHIDACVNFAVAAGMMSEQDAEIAKKTGGKGPGGCDSKESCDAFCNNPDNQETCFNFSKDNGLISPADLQKMEEGQKQTQQALQNAPAQVLDCLNSALGSDTISKLKSGEIMPTKDIGDKMSQCFSQMKPPANSSEPQGQPQMNPGEGMAFPPLSSMPQNMQDCIKAAIGSDAFSQLQSGSVKDAGELFNKANSCFGSYRPQQQFQQGMPPQQNNNQPSMPQGDNYQNESGQNYSVPPQGIGSSSPQQIMPQQNFEGQPGQYPSGSQEMPAQEGMPLNQINSASGTPPSGVYPEPMAPQGQIQPIAPPPLPQTSTPPQSYNYPSADSLFGLIANFLLK